MKIFITGASGYIGGMLAERFLEDSKVEGVIALDMKPPPARFSLKHPKLSWINHNLGDSGWEEKVLKIFTPDVIIHAAYVIRQGYGAQRAWQIKSNITAAERVFDFAFQNKIKRLIHFSTVASYGALASNSTGKRFKEEDPFVEASYLYGVDKKVIEEKLQALYTKAHPATQVLVVRPSAVTGPRGQFMFRRFGLLLVKKGLPFIPLTGKDSARQFVHEDDVFEAIQFMAKDGIPGAYEVFNLASPDFFLLKDMARELGKISVKIPMILGKLTFGFLWHVTRGRIPTVPAGINSYTYPIIVDGSKITRFGFKYNYSGHEALKAARGYWVRFIQPAA
ncbi:MAG: NAD-dependent epimerase/dehydratase family protein [bacterium]|nr:NAD-dependent epimerase/dehydratase family protein [bacterium]